MNENHKKNPLISGVLSFIFPGAGQLYNEEYGKGLILFAAAVAAIISIVHSALSLGNQMINGEVFPEATQIIKIVASSFIYFGLWLYGMIDGVIRAQHISTNTGVNPEGEVSNPKTKEGLIGMGVFLIIIGILAFLNQMGLKLEYLIKYGWPVALILLGIYLLAKTTGLIKGGK